MSRCAGRRQRRHNGLWVAEAAAGMGRPCEHKQEWIIGVFLVWALFLGTGANAL